MNNIILTTYLIGNKELEKIKIPSSVELIRHSNNTNYENAQGKYISFIDSEDKIDKNYFKYILKEIKKNNFDICNINYRINYDYKRKEKIRTNTNGINNLIPTYTPYIWNYVFKKENLLKIKQGTIKEEDFNTKSYISEPIYFHNKDHLGTKILSMTTRRRSIHFKNIIYIGEFCNGRFNGYITWLLQIGKSFPNLDITILHTGLPKITKDRLSKYFKCVDYNPTINFTCEKLITTYSTYFYPNNIYSLEENIIFIHGIMNHYKHATVYTNDIYDRYIAVSKTSKDCAKGYFPTKKIEYIYNPYTHIKEEIKPHLRLVSALRNTPHKGINRIKQVAKILDEENIPYTWSVFTDVLEPNQGGLIFRSSVTNVIDYMQDADYVVQLSSAEALSYTLLESLCSQIKIITTELPSVHELNVIDGENGIVIPFDYFEESNKELLKEKILEAYNKKDLKFDYHYDKKRFEEYHDIFNK